MKYLVWDLKQLKKGEPVKATLTENAANVRLINSSKLGCENYYINKDLFVFLSNVNQTK